MDTEQIIKRLEWLDEERRKDKITIAALQERIAALEGALPGINQQVKEISAESSRTTANLGRFDQIDTNLAQLRVESTRALETVERARTEAAREQEKVRLADLESLNKSIAEIRKGLDPIAELRRNLQARVEEDYRLSRLIEEVEQKVTNARRSDEEYRHTLKLLEESQRQDGKRLTDIQGEVASLRKRVEEQRGRVDVIGDNQRRIENRINEITTSESERRQNQVSFIERQTLLNVERDRIWKEWQTRFEQIEKISTNLDTQFQALDATHRAVKRSQEGFEDITQRFERRINEITEMQRLVEDRFRQEWVSFKADDQKRWTNYTLAHEEQQRETSRQFDKLFERLTAVENSSSSVQTVIQKVQEDTGKRLQALLVVSRQLVDQYEQSSGKK